MNQRIPHFNLRPLLLTLSLVFPLAAQAATIESILFLESSDTPSAYAVVTPTSSAFIESANITKQTIGSNPTEGTSTVSADGVGHFGLATTLKHDPTFDPGGITSSSKLIFSDTITNTTAVQQTANFGIAINALNVSLTTGWMGSASASFVARVFVNNSTTATWESTFAIDSPWVKYSCSDAGCIADPLLNPTTYTQSGALSLNQTARFSSVTGNKVSYTYGYALSAPYNTSLLLGSLNPNETVSVRYEIDIAARNYAYGGTVAVNFDDPSGIALSGGNSAAPVAAQLSFAQAVPEPETYAMMAAGLGLVAAAARRRRQRV